MKRRNLSRRLFVVVIVTIGLSGFPLVGAAQEDNPKETAIEPGDVALIDMARLFKEHVGFNDAMKKMKDEISAFEAEVNERRSAIEKRDADAKTLLEGTEERAAIDAEVLKAKSDLQVDLQVKRQNLLNREGRLYATTYEEITAEVERYSKKFGIRLVVRFDRQSINPEDRESVLKGVNRNIVFQDGLDITDVILERINGKTALVD